MASAEISIEASDFDSEYFKCVIESLRDKYGSEQLKVIEDQGDYTYILKLHLGCDIWAQICVPRTARELMDVFVRSEREISTALKQNFNRDSLELRNRTDLANLLEKCTEWWNQIGSAELSISTEKKFGKKTKKTKANAEEEEDEKNSKMKPSQDVVKRIMWDPALNKEDFTVGYIDRFIGVIEKPFTAFNWDNFDTVDPEESAIPRHRIQYFKFKDTIVWDRRARLDLIFQSTPIPKNKKSLEELLAVEKPLKLDESSSEEEEEYFVQAIFVRNTNDTEQPSTSDANDDIKPNVDYYSDVPPGVRPDYYFAVAIRNPKTVDDIKRVQDSLRSSAVKKFAPSDSFHLTLCLLCKGDLGPEGIERVLSIIESYRSEIQALVNDLRINFQGLRLLRRYKVVVSEPEPDSMSPLWNKLLEIFSLHKIKFYVPTKFHLTICRLRSVYDPSVWHPMENLCSLSRFTTTETDGALIVKESGTPFSAGYLLTIENTKPIKSEPEPAEGFQVPEKLVGFHIRDAHKYERLGDIIYKASGVGAKSFAFFFNDNRSLEDISALDSEQIRYWNKALEKTGINVDHIVPHGSYPLNPGSSDRMELGRTRIHMIQAVARCQSLGIKHYNFHIGQLKKGYKDTEIEEFLSRVALSINVVINETPDSNVILLMETGAGQGSEIGWKFEHLKTVIDLVKNKARIGICIDTCHIFAAGYDIRTEESYSRTMLEFDSVIGIRPYLKAIHLNDSKGKLGERVDRHEIIGKGRIGETAFRCIMHDARLNHIPIIMETPWSHDDHLEEIKLLAKLEKELGWGPATNETELKEEVVVDAKRISSEIWTYYESNIETEEGLKGKEEARKKLQKMLEGSFPTNMELVIIGGTISGIATKGSDLDLCLVVPQENRGTDTDYHFALNTLRTAYNKLERINGKEMDILGLRWFDLRPGVVPVLRIETFSNLQIDINCNDASSVYDSHLLHCYSRIFRGFPALCLVIKKWAGVEKINDAASGFVNSYTFVLMALHFLQSKQILPNIQSLYPERFSKRTPLEQLIYEDEDLPVVDYKDIGDLLIEFFKYYADFPYDSEWISISTASRLDRTLLDQQKYAKFQFVIEDPFEARNTARCLLEQEKMDAFKSKFKAAAELLKKSSTIQHLISEN